MQSTRNLTFTWAIFDVIVNQTSQTGSISAIFIQEKLEFS